MPGTTPSPASPDVAFLDSKIVGDICAGAFYVDLTPTIWIGSGASNVEGASVKITNPYGVVIKNFPTSGYDIYPPMTSIVGVDIPTQASTYQYGSYTVDVKLTDSDGTEYTVTKTIKLCQPDALNKQRNYGSLSAQLNGICRDGKMFVIVDTPPNYNGAEVESQVNDFTLEYPTGSGLDDLETDISSFSVQLYEGVYKISGTICALYDKGDYIFYKVNYRVKKKKEIYCSIDDCCVSAKFNELKTKLDSDCTDAERSQTASVIVDALFYLQAAKTAANCGEDPSDFIASLEAVLGCKCTCNCNDGTPIINNDPARDFSITGCGIEKTTVGLTDNYVINNYTYTVYHEDNGGVLTVGSQTTSSCNRSQIIRFNISPAYAQIKGLASANSTEALFWASVINTNLSNVDATCLGYSSESWATLSLAQKLTVVIAAACASGNCSAAATGAAVASQGADVLLTWTDTGAFSVDIYLDGVFIGNVLANIEEFIITGASDGEEHTYAVIPKCSNGKIGTTATGTFTFLACPSIEPPTVSSNTVDDAECPFDLETLLSSLPSGITAEWHTANNTLPGTVLGDPTSVTSGVYFVFAKNDDGCYSISRQVTVICAADSDCSAPQNLSVETITGGNKVSFQSAAFPPPANSYTVFRKPGASADIPGNYTTIGTPTFNSGTGKWEILDATAVANTLYTYKAQSNCASTTPYILYNYANITCPSVSLTPGATSVDYSFVPVGGSVTQYLVRIYDASGTTLLETDTFLPSFSNPITGTFTYLDSNTQYKVRVRIYIGSYYVDCALQDVETTSDVVGDDYRIDNDSDTICSASTTTLYSDGAFAPGVTMYTNSGLTVALTGYTYIVDPNTNAIYNINTSTGVVGSDTGLDCVDSMIVRVFNQTGADVNNFTVTMNGENVPGLTNMTIVFGDTEEGNASSQIYGVNVMSFSNTVSNLTISGGDIDDIDTGDPISFSASGNGTNTVNVTALTLTLANVTNGIIIRLT